MVGSKGGALGGRGEGVRPMETAGWIEAEEIREAGRTNEQGRGRPLGRMERSKDVEDSL